MKVWVSFTCECTFSQEVEVSEELYNRLLSDDGNDIFETEQNYRDVEDLIDFKDILLKGSFDDFTISAGQ